MGSFIATMLSGNCCCGGVSGGRGLVVTRIRRVCVGNRGLCGLW